MDRLAEYDELILMNYTFFAPIFPFAETFDVMDARDDLDFWGLTAHKADRPQSRSRAPTASCRCISSPIGLPSARRCSPRIEFAWYWEKMPTDHLLHGFDPAARVKFTQHFSDRGFRYTVTFDPDRYPSDHPMFESVVLMLEDRCPILKRRIFFHEPTYLERNAILGKRVMELVEQDGLPGRPDLAQRRPFRRAAHAVHEHVDAVGHPGHRPRSAAGSAAADLRARAHLLRGNDRRDDGLARQHPGALRPRRHHDHATSKKMRDRERAWPKYGLRSVQSPGRRVQPRAGRRAPSSSACRDVLTSGDYDLVLKVHSKKSPQNGYNLGAPVQAPLRRQPAVLARLRRPASCEMFQQAGQASAWSSRRS